MTITIPLCKRCGCEAPLSKRPLMYKLKEWPLCKPCYLVAEREVAKRRNQRGR